MRFQIKHGLFLQSANKLLTPNTFFVTEDDAQIKELREVFAEAVEEVKPPSKEKKVPEANTVIQDDDITLAKLGAAAYKKLEAKGIVTMSGLKAALSDAARVEEMKEILGAVYDKAIEKTGLKPDSEPTK